MPAEDQEVRLSFGDRTLYVPYNLVVNQSVVFITQCTEITDDARTTLAVNVAPISDYEFEEFEILCTSLRKIHYPPYVTIKFKGML